MVIITRYFKFSRGLLRYGTILFILQLLFFINYRLFISNGISNDDDNGYFIEYKVIASNFSKNTDNDAIDQKCILFNNSTNYAFSKKCINSASASVGSWQKVGGITAFKFLVFSAFLDIREKKVVKLIAVTKTRLKKNEMPKIWCIFQMEKNKNNNKIKIKINIEAKLTIIQEHWNLFYSAYYVICPLKENDPIPDTVSLVTDIKKNPENLLKVIINYNRTIKWNPREVSHSVKKLAICVKPLHYEYNSIYELMEFIELYRLLGVDHFFFYNHTVGPQVNCLLEKYKTDDGLIITILPWQLPIKSQVEIRTEGIFAALNDCLFRTMFIYSHTIFVDLDEFIIPTNHKTLRNLFEHLNSNYDIKKKSTFLFQNSFFYKQWPNDPDLGLLINNDPIGENLMVLRKTRRLQKFHPHRRRSKLIVIPELVETVGNHFVWTYFSTSIGPFNVDPKDAFMHHYRVCETGGDDCVKNPSTIDKKIYRYKENLIAAVKNRFNKYSVECSLNDVENSK